MRKIVLPALLAVGIVAAVGAYALASANPQLPMSGQIELYGGPTGETRGTDANRIALEGDGTLAHAGAVHVTATNCSGADLATSPAEISGGTATYTAADGSSISVSYEGQHEAPVGTVSDYSTTQTVTGGTGRFANASGSWTVAGTVDIATGRLLGVVDGWIRY